MRICFIVGTFPSLSETFILNQMTGLLDQGHTVHIFAGARSEDVIVHEDVIRSGLLNHVYFYNDMPRSGVARILKFLGILPLSILRSPKVVMQSLNFFRFGREAWSLKLFFQTVAFLVAREDDIVLGHFGQNGLVGLKMKKAGALKGKLVTVFHASDITAYVWREGRNIYKDLFDAGDLVLPINRSTKGKLLELGCPDQKIQVHRMGVDMSQFRITTRKRFGTAPLKLLSVARLLEKKGIGYGLEAVALLAKEGIVCDYTIVGDGPLRKDLEAQAKGLKIEQYVHFPGWQDSGTIRRRLKDADVFLAPSIRTENGDDEGVPVVLMEAMASRVPVVTTPTDGICELLEEGKTGFFLEEKNARSCADKLKYLWTHPEAAEKVASGGRALIEEQYSVETLNQVLVKLLTAVIYERRTA